MVWVSARADWLNLSGADNAPNIAEINIQDDHVQLVLEIYIGDLSEFEPVLLLVVGLVVGFIVFAMLLPIFDIGSWLR